MWPDPYNAIMPVWAQILVGVIFIATAILVGGHKRPDRVPSVVRGVPHEVTPLAVGRASLRRPFDWAEDDQTNLDLFFEDTSLEVAVRPVAFDRVVDRACARRGLSVVDAGVQSHLYPGRVPLREVSALSNETSPAA